MDLSHGSFVEDEKRVSLHSLEESSDTVKQQMDLQNQSVVYQNKEDKWDTDLAYYRSFNSEQDLSIQTNEMNEHFLSGAVALDLIARDEEKFNKEHQFMQEENIDIQSTHVAGDKSWETSINSSLLKSNMDFEDASFSRLSLGEYFAQRSEALGCLGGGHNVKRPSFGYVITSPEIKQPEALIRNLDLSGSELENKMTPLRQEPVSDLKAFPKHGVRVSENELDVFRPSALPLSHSSPIDVSGTSLPRSKSPKDSKPGKGFESWDSE